LNKEVHTTLKHSCLETITIQPLPCK